MARTFPGHRSNSNPDLQGRVALIKENTDEQSTVEDDEKDDGAFELASARACIGPKMTKGQIKLLLSMRKRPSPPLFFCPLDDSCFFLIHKIFSTAQNETNNSGRSTQEFQSSPSYHWTSRIVFTRGAVQLLDQIKARHGNNLSTLVITRTGTQYFCHSLSFAKARGHKVCRVCVCVRAVVHVCVCVHICACV
jgi:hypothetical protein